jgi:hypothetical protein
MDEVEIRVLYDQYIERFKGSGVKFETFADEVRKRYQMLDEFFKDTGLEQQKNVVDYFLSFLELDENGRTRSALIYEMYTKDCESKELNPISRKKFGRDLGKWAGKAMVVKTADKRSERVYRVRIKD